jgi:hypothetical protein
MGIAAIGTPDTALAAPQCMPPASAMALNGMAMTSKQIQNKRTVRNMLLA